MDCKSTNQNAVRRNQIYAYAHYSSHLLKSKVLGKNNLRTTFVLLNASYCERFFFSSRFYCCSFRATICMFHNYSRSVRRVFFGHFRDIRALISVLLCYDHISLKHIQSIDHIILMEHYQYIHYKMSIIEALFFL